MAYGEYDDELEKIRKKKAEEYRKYLEQVEKQRQIRALLSEYLTEEALERLDTAKLTRPEIAEEAQLLIITLLRNGQLKPPIDENVVKKILVEIYRRRRGGGKIEIKRK